MFQREARMILADLYAGFLHHEDFLQMMSEIVVDKPLEGSTPQHPKREVRTLVVNGKFEVIVRFLTLHF